MKTATLVAALVAYATTASAAPRVRYKGVEGHDSGSHGSGDDDYESGPACIPKKMGHPSPAGGTCPANPLQLDGKLLPGKATVPTSLQVPMSKNKPDKAFPASEWAVITPNDFCTVFNLVLDAEDTVGKLCNLVFDLPQAGQGPAPYAYRYSGPGHFTFTGYDLDVGAVPGNTTYNNPPRAGPNPPNPPAVLAPGNSYVIHSAPCPPIVQAFPGKPEITVSGSLCSTDSTLIFKMGEGQCPVGFYVLLTDDPAVL
jgi:hypothetical protein